MIKILNIIKIASFVVLVVTSIPMIVCYFLNTTPHIIFIVDIGDFIVLVPPDFFGISNSL